MKKYPTSSTRWNSIGIVGLRGDNKNTAQAKSLKRNQNTFCCEASEVLSQLVEESQRPFFMDGRVEEGMSLTLEAS